MPTSQSFSANQKGLAPVLIILLIAVALGGYFVYTNYSNSGTRITQPQPKLSPIPPGATYESTITQPSSSPEETLKKTLITAMIPGKYTNEEYGYTVEFPKEWELYTYYTPVTGNRVQLYHPKCKGEEYIPPEKKVSCTNVALPAYIGSIGWGYGNKKQVEETVSLKNGIKANKTTFYYDDKILISWTFNIDIPDKCKELGISALVAFADLNDNFTPGSLKTVDSIIKSLEFAPLKDTNCQ